MSIIPYSYGGFNLNDLATYFVEGGIDLSPPPVNPTTVQIARDPGLKKTGEVIGEKKFSLIIGVLSPDGTRAGLRIALDALNAALMGKRQQQIVLQDDSRYMIGDCVQIQTPIKGPNYAACQCDFECYQPFAYAANPSTATIAGTLTGGGPYSISGNITGGGTQTALPKIVVTNTGAVNITSLTIANTTQNASITTSGLTLAPGDYLTIYCDPAAANQMGYTITKNGVTSTLYDFTGIFPSQDTGTDAWTITATASSAPTLSAAFTWTPIYQA